MSVGVSIANFMKDTALRDATILELHDNGKRIREICDLVGVSRNTVGKVLKENDRQRRHLPWYSNNCGLTEDDFSDVVADYYRNGMKMQDIADKLGAKLFSVRRVCRERRLSPSGKRLAHGIASRQERTDRILDMRIKGCTYEKISKSLGVSRSIVYRTCASHGVNAEMNHIKQMDLEQKVLEMYNDGVPAKRIKAELHTSYNKVRAVLDSHGLSSNNKSSEIEARNQLILEMASEGSTVAEIAEELGMNKYTVYHIMAMARKRDANLDVSKPEVGNEALSDS